MTGSSKTRSTLTVGKRSYDYWSFANLPRTRSRACRISLKILLENLLRYEDGVNVTARRHRRGARLGRQGRALLRNRLHARARDHAGLHRRALRRRPRRDARGRAEARRRSRAHQSAESRRTGHRSLGAGGRLRHASSLATNNRDRVRAQRRALRVPALGPDRVPQLQGGAAEHRHRPPGEPRVPRPRRVPQRHRRARTRPIPTPWSAPIRTPR